MELYHGSNQAIEKPKLVSLSNQIDFGAGFYTTTNYEQAVSFARRVVWQREGSPIVSVYSFDYSSVSSDKILKFDAPDVEWLRFVIANRRMRYKDEGYELIIGPVADDDVYQTIDLLEDGTIDEEFAIKRLKVKQLFIQYVFKTQDIMDKLFFKEIRYV